MYLSGFSSIHYRSAHTWNDQVLGVSSKFRSSSCIDTAIPSHSLDEIDCQYDDSCGREAGADVCATVVQHEPSRPEHAREK